MDRCKPYRHMKNGHPFYLLADSNHMLNGHSNCSIEVDMKASGRGDSNQPRPCQLGYHLVLPHATPL